MIVFHKDISYTIKILINILLILCMSIGPYSLFSQDLYTPTGGSGGQILSKINYQNHQVKNFCNFDRDVLDISFTPDGKLYGTDGYSIFTIDTINCKVSIIYTTTTLGVFVGMASDWKGNLYLTSDLSGQEGILSKFNPVDNSLEKLAVAGSFMPDLDWYNGNLYLTGNNILIPGIELYLYDDQQLEKFIWVNSYNDQLSAALVSTNNLCESETLTAILYEKLVKYSHDLSSFVYDPITQLGIGPAGGASLTSWLGSLPPFYIDSILVQNDPCAEMNSNGKIIISNSSGRERVRYSIDGGNTYFVDSIFTNLPTGDYHISVMDSVGCERRDTVHVDSKPFIQFSIVKTKCNLNNGSLKIDKIDPGINYTISIDGASFSTIDSIPNLSAGPHQLIIEYDSGCRDTSIVTIDATPVPDFSVTQSISDDYCDQNNGKNHLVSTDLNNGIYYSIDGINYTKDSINLTQLNAGNYPVFLRHETGCLDTINFEIKSFPPSQFNSINITPANCNMSDGVITATSSETNDEIKLNGIISVNGIFDQLAQGNYTIEIKNNYGCITDSIVFLSGKNVPVVESISADDAHCDVANGSIKVQSSQSTDQYSIDGINYQNSNLFNNLSSGNYNIFIQNTEGCIEMRNAAIIQTGLPLIDSLITTDESCYQNNGAVRIYTSGNAVITYTLNDDINNTKPSFESLKSGIYTIAIKDAYGCEQFAYFTLQNTGAIKDINAIQVQQGNCAQPLSTLSLPINQDDKYSIEGISETPDGTYMLLPGKYTIHIENDLCSRDTTIVIPSFDCEPYIPNVFSPNDDGVNDVFKLEGAGFDIVDFRIYNRWGDVVFSEQKSNNGWNGRFKGKAAEAGVYTYFVKIGFGGSVRVIKGDVTLVR